jgi:predicted RNase H-like HicB family nuclease
MSSRYAVIIRWSSDDNCFVAEVPDLPGCMADGGTYQEVATNAEAAIREWVETAIALGRPVPQPKARVQYA